MVPPLEHDELSIVIKADPQFLAGRTSIGTQSRSKRRIDPRLDHNLRTERRRARVENLNLAAYLLRANQSLADEDLPHGGLHDFVLAKGRIRIDRMLMMVSVMRGH